jgi:phosphatidylserine/phosphatidylglycerophosphate/cardiolipin synthase-like enzyme
LPSVLIDRIDRSMGKATERAIRSHHLRRLRKVNWEQALDPPAPDRWCAGDPPPRKGCSLEVLIDGEAALPAIAEAISAAKSHVHIAGWFASPDFELERGTNANPLRDLLAEVAERIPVRVLLWAGSPAPVFSPTRKTVREVRNRLCHGTRIQCELDAREHPIHCHHEKLVVVDDEVAFVGGIDLTELGGDRFDHSHHPHRGELGWHDISSRLRGPIVGDVAEHFALRWREVTGDQLAQPPAPPAPVGEQTVQLVRTIPQSVYQQVPRGDYRILEAYVRALRSARRLIYIENQFLWSPEIIEVLSGKLADPPSDEFRLVVLLPVRPNNGADVTRGQAGELERVDDSARRFLACSIYSQGEGVDPTPVYVHSKICIVDDQWMTLGSANLNERSLFNDSEVNITCDDSALATTVRERLWAEHLEMPIKEVRGRDPADLIDTVWRPIAAEQALRRQGHVPLTHRLVRLPGVSRHSRRLLGPLDSFFVDG